MPFIRYNRNAAGKFFCIIFIGCIIISCSRKGIPAGRSALQMPVWAKGRFMDDYGIVYTINDSVWILEPDARYHLLSYHKEEMYLLARNDTANRYAPGLYTRIDILPLNNMAPYTWGFCLTVFDAKTPEEAARRAVADRANPKKGCGGYPFSRMKPYRP